VVETLLQNDAQRPKAWSSQKALGEFVRILNQALYREGVERWGGPELVSTLCAVVVEGGRLCGLNLGDSRVYLWRGAELTQLSREHVLEAAAFSNVLEQAVGLRETVEPWWFEQGLEDGDMVLLCSGGVAGALGEGGVCGLMGSRAAARAVVQKACAQARERGQGDWSAVVIDVAEAGRAESGAESALALPESLAKGRVVDGYELVRPLSGDVQGWLAQKDGRRWVLRFAPEGAAGDDALLQEFVREMWNATRLKAPFFVEAFVPPAARFRFYGMEFLETPSLRVLLGSRRLSVDEAVELGRFLFDAQAHLLRHDLAHGDVKPENVLVQTDYDRLQFRLIGVGGAVEVFSVAGRPATESSMAPERFRGAAVTERTEIFAVGVTLFEALTGELPYGKVERFQIPQFGAPRDLRKLNPNVPLWLEAVVLRGIAVDPERRYTHYSEAVYELGNPSKVEPFFAADAPLLERDPLKFYKLGFWILAGLVVALVAVCVALLWDAGFAAG